MPKSTFLFFYHFFVVATIMLGLEITQSFSFGCEKLTKLASIRVRQSDVGILEVFLALFLIPRLLLVVSYNSIK